MKIRNVLLMWTAVLMLFVLAACSAELSSTAAIPTQVQDTGSVVVEATVSPTAESPENSEVVNNANLDENLAEEAETATLTAQSVAEAAAENNVEDVETPAVDNAEAIAIILNCDSIAAEGDGVTVEDRVVTLTSAGIYSLSGSLTNGQIVVDTEDDDPVQLILNGIQISNESTAPIFVANASETILVLAANSENTISDGATYVFEDPGEDEPNAAIFSKDSMVITGEGMLTVEGKYNDGIASKDGLIISGGTLIITAVDDGIRGKDYLLIENGSFVINAGGDGLKSDEDEDAEKGYIMIENGVFNISSGGDAVQGETDVLISGGEFSITTAGGSGATISEDNSAKGLKAGVSVIVDGGSFDINTADDAVHSNDSMVINDGTFVVATGDDGFHAHTSLTFIGGSVRITESYEGIESAIIEINNGEFWIASSDDGINVAGGNDSSGFGGGPGGGPGGGQPPAGGPGQDNFNANSDQSLTINGGYIFVDAHGDGIDINGVASMNDGVLLVNGPTEQMNGAIDVDGGFTINGGFMVAVGSAGMAETAGNASAQNALLMNFNGTIPAGTLINIQDSSGYSILTFAPTVAYQSVAFSSPELVIGETYTVYYDGTASGTPVDGLYGDAAYTPGTELGSFTPTDTITRLGSTGRG
jgi:hypothetical protein